MNNPENQLKSVILNEYKSIREFALKIDMPYTTLDSIFRRGVGNSSVTNVIKICNALHISVEALHKGDIVYQYEAIPADQTMEVKDIVEDVKSKLSHTETLTINGTEVDIEMIEPIIDALDFGYKMSSKKTAKAAEKVEENS